MRANVLAVLLAASAICSVQTGRLTPKSFSRLSTTPSDFSYAPPLCDSAIVAETCADLSPVTGTITQGDVEALMTASASSVAKLWKDLSFKTNTPTCTDVCHAIIGYVGEVGVLPPASDVVCYSTGTEVVCDRYVGPEILPTLVQTGDHHPSDPLPGLPVDALSGALPLVESDEAPLSKGNRSVSSSSTGNGSESFNQDFPPVDDEHEPSGMDYGSWEMVKRMSYLFRIFPEAKPTASSLAETGRKTRAGSSGGWPVGGFEKTARKSAEAKAYIIHTIAAWNRKATKRQMTKWFGSNAFSDDRSRNKIQAALNSVLRIVDNAHFVPRGKECSPRTYAYVYPASSTCTTSETARYPCTMTTDNKFVIYLCNHHFETDEMIETLVHEASHHANAMLDDVKYKGETAYGRRTCMSLASSDPRSALKNADNFCYYVQDVANEVASTPGTDTKVPVVIPAKVTPAVTPDVPLTWRPAPETPAVTPDVPLTWRPAPDVPLTYDIPVLDVLRPVPLTYQDAPAATPDVPMTYQDDDDWELDDDGGEPDEAGFETCMRSGPTGMHVKSLKPDSKGNCFCKFQSMTCFDGDEKKCPWDISLRKRSPFRHHARFAATCFTCKCKY